MGLFSSLKRRAERRARKYVVRLLSDNSETVVYYKGVLDKHYAGLEAGTGDYTIPAADRAAFRRAIQPWKEGTDRIV